MPTAKSLYALFEFRFPWLIPSVTKYVSNRKDGGIDIYLNTGEHLFYTENPKGWLLRKGDI